MSEPLYQQEAWSLDELFPALGAPLSYREQPSAERHSESIAS